MGKSDEESPGCYQVRQPPEAGIIGSPFLQPKALPNSSKFCTVPLTRHSPVECGLVLAWLMAACCVSRAAPDLREGDEEALVGRVAVALAVDVAGLCLGSLFLQRVLKRLEGDADAGVVGGVLTECQMAVEVDACPGATSKPSYSLA